MEKGKGIQANRHPEPWYWLRCRHGNPGQADLFLPLNSPSLFLFRFFHRKNLSTSNAVTIRQSSNVWHVISLFLAVYPCTISSGKTLLTISFLAHLKHHWDSPDCRAPKSTLQNWYCEFKQWTPDFNIVTLLTQGTTRGNYRLSPNPLPCIPTLGPP